jgi:hypothetical protein
MKSPRGTQEERASMPIGRAALIASVGGQHEHSDGRACYERKLAAGKTHKEALRCLKRRISDAIYARLRADARKGRPGGQPGNHSVSRAASSHPAHRLFGQATPGPQASLRSAAPLTPAIPPSEPPARKPGGPLDNDDNKEDSIWRSAEGRRQQSAGRITG